ncbi:unnamed protein product [Sphagnum jensenii]
MERDVAVTLESASSEILEVDIEKMSLCDPVETERTNVSMLDSDTDDDSDGGLQSVEPIDDKSEFGNTELEKLKKGGNPVWKLHDVQKCLRCCKSIK